MVQDESLSGKITIPEYVSFNNVSYKVINATNAAFKGTNITEIVLPNTITLLGESCFYDCSNLKAITLPNDITSLGNSCFRGCSEIESITLPNNITSLGNSCFYGCSSLKSILLPNSIISLGDGCFSGCKGLESITFPNSITSLGNYCFSGCYSIETITLPNSITSLGEDCFYACTSLKYITLSNSITSLGRYCFRECRSLESITLPESITSLGNYCFWKCSCLEFVTLPNSIISLGALCFSECYSLKSITLSSSITSINNECFKGCTNLINVTCEWKTLDNVAVASDAFSNIFSEAQLHIPSGTYEMYKTTMPWSNFKYIIEDGGTSEPVTQCTTPTINYSDKRLMFTSLTEGAQYHYTITDDDVKTEAFSESGYVDLSAKYNISVYASADGYINSDRATATLYFINAGLESTTDVLQIEKQRGVLISTDGGYISISGLDDNEKVYLYNLQGVSLAEGTACAGTVSLNAGNEKGIVIVKIGEQSIKVKLNH